MCILFPIFSVIIISCSDSNKNDKNQNTPKKKHDDSRNFSIVPGMVAGQCLIIHTGK